MTLETDRLYLRHLTLLDAAFMLDLLNSPGWLRYIGDREVRTVPEARVYLQKGALLSYQQHGYGVNLVVRKDDGAHLGICGIINRQEIETPDLGYAFLPAYEGQGYAVEAARCVLENTHLPHVLAIVSPDNARSIHLLEKLDFIHEKTIEFHGETNLQLHWTNPGFRK